MTLPKSKFERFFLVLGLLMIVVGLGYGLADWSGGSAWARYKHEWEAKGEKFDFKDFIPPPVPADQNFALTPIVASGYEAYLDRNGHKMIPNRTNIVNRMAMEIPGGYSTTGYSTNAGDWQKGKLTDLRGLDVYFRGSEHLANVPPPMAGSPAADVLSILSQYDSNIEELRAASKLPLSRFPIDYAEDRPYDIWLPHLASLKSAGVALQLRALAEIETGDPEKALQDIHLILRLSDSTRTEPFLISALVRIALVNLAIQPVWEGLQKHRWTDGQLAELEEDLAKTDFLADYESTLRAERASAIAMVEYVRRTGDLGSDQAAFGRTVIRMLPRSVFYNNEMNIARMYQQSYLPAAEPEFVVPALINKGEATVDGWHFSPNNVLARMLLPSVGSSLRRFAHTQNSINMARVACSLERYRVSHGEYPETLENLAPQFIGTVPRDIIDGVPLHYHRTADGKFSLYSIGWNQVDDNGEIGFYPPKKVRFNLNLGDWVWPTVSTNAQTATE